MKLKAPGKKTGWTLFTVGIVVIVGIVLVVLWSKGYFNAPRAPSVAPSSGSGSLNVPDFPEMVQAAGVYNDSTKNLDVTYTITPKSPAVNQPESYKVFLVPYLTPNAPPPSDALYLDTIPYQNIQGFVYKTSYPYSTFKKFSPCSNYTFGVWGYKNGVYSNSYMSSGKTVSDSVGFSTWVPGNLPATQAAYVGNNELKIITSSYSEFPCWADIGRMYSIGYVTRTSTDGNTWSSDYSSTFTFISPRNVLFWPASTSQTSYVQIAAYNNNTSTLLSPWSATITVPASSS